MRIDLASPGESCRIGRVFDVYAPRAKDDGDGDFPGEPGGLLPIPTDDEPVGATQPESTSSSPVNDLRS